MASDIESDLITRLRPIIVAVVKQDTPHGGDCIVYSMDYSILLHYAISNVMRDYVIDDDRSADVYDELHEFAVDWTEERADEVYNVYRVKESDIRLSDIRHI